MTARHRAPRGSTGVVVAGLAAAAVGAALLLAPTAPVAARAGSVLDGPAASSPAVEAPGGAPVEAPVGDAPSSAAFVPPSGDPDLDPAAPVATSGPAPQAFEARRLPVPVVTGFVPERLVVEALAVDAPLVSTLVDAAGAFVPPDDPAELGWWRGVRPGQGRGSVLVAGHIDSTRFGQGPLARLVDLVPGDRAVVLGPDGARADYVVRGIETFPKEAFPAADLFSTEGPERLVLVTCGGTYDRGRGSWDSNIVAVLDRVPPG